MELLDTHHDKADDKANSNSWRAYFLPEPILLLRS